MEDNNRTPEDDIRSHFTKTVGDYDTVAGSVVMKNEELHEKLVEGLTFDEQEHLQVLDLGCGTGHGMGLVLQKFPNAFISGVDFSPSMIEKARDNLSAFKGRFGLHKSDFRDVPFREEAFDGVISAVSIHNVSHSDKKALFKRIYNILKPGGVFVNGDFFEGEDAAEMRELQAEYREYLQSHLQGEELQVWLHHAFEEDMPMKLSAQELELQRAGFKNIEILWKHGLEAVYRCVKE